MYLMRRHPMTEHGRGWVDAQLRIRPPWRAHPDYIAGYREGLRSRVHDVLAAVNEIAAGEHMTARKEHRHMVHLGKAAPFTCAPHASSAPPRRVWDARPLVLFLALLALSAIGSGLLLPYL